MRITHEADYAIRIVFILSTAKGRVGAKDISELTGVSLRFSLKILRKLLAADIVKSYKGINGGYELSAPPSEVSFARVIEAIDGSIAINHCLTNEFECTRPVNKACDFQIAFAKINKILENEFSKLTFDQFIDN